METEVESSFNVFNEMKDNMKEMTNKIDELTFYIASLEDDIGRLKTFIFIEINNLKRDLKNN